jgi:hypothetical protein
MKTKSIFLPAALLLGAVCSCSVTDDPIRTENPELIISPRHIQPAPEVPIPDAADINSETQVYAIPRM